MRVVLKFYNKKEFVEIIKKMALPSKNGGSYIYPVISPMLQISPVFKEGILEWIAKDNVLTWVRAKCGIISGYEKPVRIPIYVDDVLKYVNIFNSSDEIYFIHDTDKQCDVITDKEQMSGVKDEKTEIIIPFKIDKNISVIYDSFPEPIDENEVILLKDGTQKLDISGTFEKEFIDNIEKVKKVNKVHNSKARENNEDIIGFSINGAQEKIESFIGNGKNTVVVKRLYKDIVGSGELHYENVFMNVMNILKGKVKFFAIDKGPIWIMQEDHSTKVRYLITPACPISTKSEKRKARS